jgi:hypothetical protein
MPLTDAERRVRSRDARIGLVGAWGLVAIAVIAEMLNIDPRNPVFLAVLSIALVLSVLLWVMMWREFFRERPTKFSLLWAALLLSGPVLGPLLFYHWIWKPRHESGAL